MNECIFDIDPKLLSLASEAESECREMFEKIDSNAEYNGQKVLKAFIDNRVSEGCLKGTTGYGYGDMGRDTIDKVFAQALGGEDALVRHTFVNGLMHCQQRFSACLEAETQCLPALESHMILLRR